MEKVCNANGTAVDFFRFWSSIEARNDATICFGNFLSMRGDCESLRFRKRWEFLEFSERTTGGYCRTDHILLRPAYTCPNSSVEIGQFVVDWLRFDFYGQICFRF